MTIKINVKGPIISNDDKWIYDYFEMESTAPKDVSDQLTDNGEAIEVTINSGGGDVYAGSEIYTSLKDYSGVVTVKIVGLAASAASLIAMAGDKVLISPTAQIMIHNVSTVLYGDHQTLDKESVILQSHDKSIASAYELKTGKSIEDILALMENETWMNAQSAVEEGFADEVMFQNEALKLVAGIQTPLLPQNVIDTIRNAKQPVKMIEASSIAAQITAEDVTEIVNTILEKQTELKKESDLENAKPKSRFFF